jgi:predicted RNase H-like nuclease (RuvC/YqgF family)
VCVVKRVSDLLQRLKDFQQIREFSKMDPIRLFIWGCLDQLTSDFITTQNRMATLIKANQEMMEAKMKMLLSELYNYKQANATLAQQLEVKSGALANASNLLKEANDKVKELESVMTKQQEEIERLLRNGNVTTVSQTIEKNDHHSLQPTEAAEKIRTLEDELCEKRKYVTKLKNKLTRQRL